MIGNDGYGAMLPFLPVATLDIAVTKIPCALKSIFLTDMSLKVLTGPLHLQTRSVITLCIVNF